MIGAILTKISILNLEEGSLGLFFVPMLHVTLCGDLDEKSCQRPRRPVPRNAREANTYLWNSRLFLAPKVASA